MEKVSFRIKKSHWNIDGTKNVTVCGVFLVQEKGDQECQKSDFHQRKEADILFEKREEPFNIYEYCKK